MAKIDIVFQTTKLFVENLSNLLKICSVVAKIQQESSCLC